MHSNFPEAPTTTLNISMLLNATRYDSFHLSCSTSQAMAQYVVNLNVWSHNLLVLLGRRFSWRGAADARCAHNHDRLSWGAATVFVIAYSFLVSMTVPYFSSLVGELLVWVVEGRLCVDSCCGRHGPNSCTMQQVLASPSLSGTPTLVSIKNTA